MQVTEQHVLAAEEQLYFSTARDSVLSSLHIKHHIVVDQYDLCALVKSNKIRKPKVGLLQQLCENFELEVPSPARRKAPYIARLQELVDSYPCSLK